MSGLEFRFLVRSDPKSVPVNVRTDDNADIRDVESSNFKGWILVVFSPSRLFSRYVGY